MPADANAPAASANAGGGDPANPDADFDATGMPHCNPQRSVAAQSEFRIELPRAGTTGYQWFVDVPSDSGLRLLSEGVTPASDEPGKVGGLVRQWWHFRAGTQSVVLTFFLHPTWSGKGDASERCRVEIHVQ